MTEGLGRLSDDYQEQSAINLRRIGQITGFGIFTTVGGVLAFSVLFMYAGYLSTLSEALSGQSITLDQIREDQIQLTSSPSKDQMEPAGEPNNGQKDEEEPNKNPILATRDAMVTDFIENNEDFKKIESIYHKLGRYNEMTPHEFLDSIAPEPAKPQRRSSRSPDLQDGASAKDRRRDGRP